MRTLTVGALAATLVGCSCPLPPQAGIESCVDANGFACFDRTAASRPIEPEPASFKANSATIKVKSTIAAKTEKPSSAHTSDRAHLAIKTAKSTVAAQLQDPASAEFGEMKRAIRKNLRGESVDTICGRVKGKKASGEDAGDRPFLYLVKDDEAYVVDGPAGSAAATAYRNICN